MTSSKIAAVVLGAGKGTRMKSDLPKVLMPICGKPMIRNILDTLDGMDADKIVVVTAPDGELVRKEVAPHRSVIQQQQLGTGDAVMAAAPVLEGFDGDVLTIFGDHPIITKETFLKAVDKRREGYSGVMCFDGSLMFDILREIGNENAAHEYYLTDAVAIARARGLKCGVVECPAEEVAGANTREELALLEQYLMKREGK